MPRFRARSWWWNCCRWPWALRPACRWAKMGQMCTSRHEQLGSGGVPGWEAGEDPSMDGWPAGFFLRIKALEKTYIVIIPSGKHTKDYGKIHHCIAILYWLGVTGTMEIYDFPFSWECHHPNWLSLHHIVQRGRLKPPTRNMFIELFTNTSWYILVFIGILLLIFLEV